MKMLKNGLEADVFATSRIPIRLPLSTKREVGPRCAAPPPERPVQVHHHHHAEDGAEAAAVAEPVVDAREQKIYKNRVLPLIVLVSCVADAKARWDANANAPRPDVAPPPNDHGAVK